MVADGDIVALTLFDVQGRARAVVEVDDEEAAFTLNDHQEDRAARLTVRDPKPREKLDYGATSLHLRNGVDESESEIELLTAPGVNPLIGAFRGVKFGVNGSGGGDLETRPFSGWSMPSG